MVLELGINLQDIRVPVSMETTLRLIRNQRNKLTYLPEKIWHMRVRDIARHNKEVRISGQDSHIDIDPREIPNYEELKTAKGQKYLEDRKKKLRNKNLENQPPTKDQLERRKVEAYEKRNEIDQKRFELEERRDKDSKELQKDKRNISPADHEYDIPNFETTKGEKSKNKYQERTMEMYNHYEDEENHEMEKNKIQGKPFMFPHDKLMG